MGVMTMNTTNNTKTTSINGVTLMSAIGVSEVPTLEPMAYFPEG
jgi:hypothetical protein